MPKSNSLYFEVELSGDAPDAISTAIFIRRCLEQIAQAQGSFYCEDVKVIPNWRLERRDE
jgi:hypothetical protein